VGIVGVPGGWSSERLADAFAARTGYRLLVDAGRVVAAGARICACCCSSGEAPSRRARQRSTSCRRRS